MSDDSTTPDMGEFENEWGDVPIPAGAHLAILTLMAQLAPDGTVSYAIVDLATNLMMVHEDNRFFTRDECEEGLIGLGVQQHDRDAMFGDLDSQMGAN